MPSADPDLREAASAAANDSGVHRPRVRQARARAHLRGRDGAAPAAVPAGASDTLDDVDLRLLRILQADGRITNLKLAATVGLSSASTHERVKRLVRDGMILGFGARLNPALLQAGLLVFAEVRLADMAAYREMIASVIWSLPGVRETRTYTVMEEVKTTNALPI